MCVIANLLGFECAATNLAFRTTRVEDTHLTLEAIPFLVGVNDSFFRNEKYFAEFLLL